MDRFDIVLEALAAAEKAAQLSTHPTNRIGAALVHPENPALIVSGFNHVPAALGALSPLDKIGASSPTVHAELSCAFSYEGDPRGTYLSLTDPFCPNCTKYMAELGVACTFIATNGLKGDFATRRADAFAEMSLLIARRAGMAVGLVDRQDRAIDWLIPPLNGGVQTMHGAYALCDTAPLLDLAKGFAAQSDQAPWACARIQLLDGSEKGLLVHEALPPGLTPDDLNRFTNPELLGKYRFAIDPLTRLLLVCKRQRFTVVDNAIATSLIPASRALINAVGFGVKHLSVASNVPEHDPLGETALNYLAHNTIMSYTKLF